MKFVFPLFVLSLLSTVGTAVDYCTLDCHQGLTHTMCTYKDETPAKACTDLKNSDLTAADRTTLLDAHNEYRNTVALGKQPKQPKAANMRLVKWDKELETIAKRWIIQCIDGHDKCRDLDDKTYVGQNRATQWNSDEASLTLKASVPSWFDEVKDFTGSSATAALAAFVDIPGTGHYTQIVWAETDRIGCAQIKYSDNMHRLDVVCNYAVGGNMMGDPIYQTGEACSKCPDNLKCSKKYPGLCGEDVGEEKSNENEVSPGNKESVGWIEVIFCSFIVTWIWIKKFI